MKYLKLFWSRIRGPKMSIQATVIRSNGTVESLGVIARGRAKMVTSTGGK